MSFSESVKKEFVREIPRSACCRRAMAYGLLFDAEIGGDRVSFDVNNEEFADYVTRLLERQFSKQIAVEKVVKSGKTYYKISFSFDSVAQRVLLLEKEGAKLSNYVEFKCADCRASFLRGIFLARGTVTMSAGNNHLEYRLIHKCRAHILEELLAACGVPPKKTERKSVLGLYFKRGEQIEDNFNLMQANEALFSVMNERISREIAITERHLANCESANIARAVESAQKHIRAIKKIESAGLLDKLGEELLETVNLRLENDTAPLSELARLHSEPISKSALNARFARILKIAESIDKK